MRNGNGVSYLSIFQISSIIKENLKLKKKAYINALKNRVSEGDRVALALLYRELNGKLRYYGQQITANLNSTVTNDLVQELFLRIAKNPYKLKEVINLEAYLFSALRRNIYQALSLEKQRRTYHETYLQRPKVSENLHEPSIEEEIIQKEEELSQKKWVEQQLKQLPPAQKEVLYFKYFNQLSYKDIAQIMVLSEQVVRNYAFRGIQKLRSANKEFPF